MSLTQAAAPTPEHLMSAPLSELFEELDVRLVESEITDAGFFGAVVRRGDGRVTLLMPPDRADWERDTIARSLIGNVLDVDLSPLPRPLFKITELV